MQFGEGQRGILGIQLCRAVGASQAGAKLQKREGRQFVHHTPTLLTGTRCAALLVVVVIGQFQVVTFMECPVRFDECRDRGSGEDRTLRRAIDRCRSAHRTLLMNQIDLGQPCDRSGPQAGVRGAALLARSEMNRQNGEAR